MARSFFRRDRSGDQGLYKHLAIIEALIFVLPFLIVFYLLFEKTSFSRPPSSRSLP